MGLLEVGANDIKIQWPLPGLRESLALARYFFFFLDAS